MQSSGKVDSPISCPFHGPEKTPSCFVNIEKENFFCFGCRKGGSFVLLKSWLEGITYEQAKWDLYKGDVPAHLLLNFDREEDELDIIYPESMLSPFLPAGEIEEREIKEKESEVYGLLKDKEGNIYLPIRDRSSNLRGCQKRLNGSNSRYDQHLRFKSGNYFFGEQTIKENQEVIILCEGGLDAVKLFGVLGIPTMAYLGSSITHNQVEKLRKIYPKELVVWSDNDATGLKNRRQIYHLTKSICVTNITGIKYSNEDPKDPSLTKADRIKEQWEERSWIPTLLTLI